jgi:tRNA threonylcarbamoyladenosine biosynthesis protein TsaB
MQAALTAPSVKEILDEKELTVKDLDAVCVGKGPGSYTGLRVGVSTAKGLCFGAGIPLLSAGTLDVLVSEAHRLGVVPAGCRAIVPMVDARRMEVYAAVFTPDGRQLTETAPVIVGPDSFADRLAEGPVLFIGDGALKCREVLPSPNAFFAEAFPTAMAMAPLADAAYTQKRFEDVAYFEPFYLKDFVATVSRKKLF